MPIANWAKQHVIHKVPVRPGNKVFALTFDDGPWPHSTRQMLKVLKENKIHATFFMVGQEVSRRPEIAREVRDAGHAIGNHSWDHPSRPRDPVAQIKRTDAAIKKAIGYTPTIFRPPYGLLKNGMARQAMRENDPVLIWSADCADWKRPGAEHIAMMIVGQASPGGIALMHDGGGDRSQTVAALPLIISRLRAKGYHFVTIPQLLAMRYVAPKPVKPKKHKPASGKDAQTASAHTPKPGQRDHPAKISHNSIAKHGSAAEPAPTVSHAPTARHATARHATARHATARHATAVKHPLTVDLTPAIRHASPAKHHSPAKPVTTY